MSKTPAADAPANAGPAALAPAAESPQSSARWLQSAADSLQDLIELGEVAMVWMAMPRAGSCEAIHFPAARPVSIGGVGPIQIGKPVGVGPKARNLPEDVRVIQEALNQVTVKGAAGGPIPFLKVDGLHGPKTQAAINKFQQTQLKIFDGVIEPNMNTIIKLNEIVGAVSEAELRVRLQLALPLVQAALMAAVANLQAVISAGPAAFGPAAVAADRLNRHFLLHTQDSVNQTATRLNLFRAYTRFLAVVSQPELLEIDVFGQFDIDRQNPRFAAVRLLGFFRPEEVDKDTGKRIDHIHLGLAFFGPEVTPDFAAFIILHELAHFLGDADGLEIDDHGRGWFDDTFVKPLANDLRLLNADSYAGFAHECRVNSPNRPPFLKTAPGGRAGRR